MPNQIGNLARLFTASRKLEEPYRKFWYLAFLSIAVGVLIQVITLFIPENVKVICPENRISGQNIEAMSVPIPAPIVTLSCKTVNAVPLLLWAIFTSSLIQIFAGVTEYLSKDEERRAFDQLFGLDSTRVGGNENKVAIVLPKFPIQSLQEKLARTMEADQSFEGIDFQEITRICNEIIHLDLVDDPNNRVVKRLGEVGETVLAKADVDAVKHLTSLLGKMNFAPPELFLDDDLLPGNNGNGNIVNNAMNFIENGNFRTIIVIGLFSNSFLDFLLEPDAGSPIYTALGNELNRCFTLKRSAQPNERGFTINASFRREKNPADGNLGMIAKATHESRGTSKTIILIGGISAIGTVGVAKFLAEKWYGGVFRRVENEKGKNDGLKNLSLGKISFVSAFRISPNNNNEPTLTNLQEYVPGNPP